MFKFRLPQQKIDPKLRRWLEKKVREKKADSIRLSKKRLKELASAVEAIRREGLPSLFILQKLPKNLGHGIFLHPEASPILKGTIIAPYSGVTSLVPQSGYNSSDYLFLLASDLELSRAEQRHWDPKGRYHPRRLYSVDLDACKEGNFTRFINHSVLPNIQAEMVQIPKNDLGLDPSPCELLYVTKKKILPGEQLLICYEGDDRSYWGPLKIKPFPMTPRTFQLKKGKGSRKLDLKMREL